jgi:hypothetical protein
VTTVTLHFDSTGSEWYVSTEGSNFLALYTASSGIHIDKQRCFTAFCDPMCVEGSEC